MASELAKELLLELNTHDGLFGGDIDIWSEYLVSIDAQLATVREALEHCIKCVGHSCLKCRDYAAVLASLDPKPGER